MLAERLRALFMRREDDIGLLRTRLDVRARVTKLPHLRIAQMHEGERGVITGVIRSASAVLESPLSLERCVAWRIHRFTGSPDAQAGLEIVEFEDATSFDLEDESGMATVSSRLLSLHVRPTFEKFVVQRFDGAEELRAHMRSQQRHSPGLLQRVDEAFQFKVSYIEQRIGVGDRLSVICAARLELDDRPDGEAPGGASNYRATRTRTVLETAPDAMFLYVTEAE